MQCHSSRQVAQISAEPLARSVPFIADVLILISEEVSVVQAIIYLFACNLRY